MKKHIYIGLILVLFTLLPAACGGGSEADSGGNAQAEEETTVSTGDPAAGETKYNEVCIACHGPGGEGIEGLGKPFTTSEFVHSKNDKDLLAFVKTGRPMGDPANTTGVDMPPKGGNPALSDDQILDIIAYLRTLNQ
ncbi:MAG: c-type cytochrome [Anaerolineae bacterium]